MSTIADEPFAVSCIGVNGSRHVIYGASSKILYEMRYSKQCMKNVAGFSDDAKQILSENSSSSGFQAEVDNVKLSSDEQQPQKTGRTTKGVDNVMVWFSFLMPIIKLCHRQPTAKERNIVI